MAKDAALPLDESIGDHLFGRACKRKRLLHLAGQALLDAHALLGILLGYRLIDLRATRDPLRIAQATVEELTVRLAANEELVALLGARWDKIPDRKRPHYTPEQRFRIVRLRRVLDLSVRDLAQTVRVSTDTIYGWDREVRAQPDRETVGSLVKPTPPVRRYADVVQHLVQTMGMLGFGGHRKIAEFLANAGLKISRRTVGRYRRRKRVTPPDAPVTTKTTPRKPSMVTARFVNHVWMMDFTTIPRLFGLRRFFVAAILDVYSRMPLAVATFTSQPDAADAVALLDAATQRFGPPRHLVTDQGKQLTAELFVDFVDGLGIKQRFGAVGQKGSIAIIERFWRTMKAAIRLRLWPPLTREDLEHRLALALAHYAHFRPHTGLAGATPAARFFRKRRPSRRAVQPPRGRPGESAPPLPVEIASVDTEGRFPVLLKAA